MVFLLFFTFLRSPDTTWWFKSELSSGQFSSCIEKYWNEFFQRGDRSCDCFYFTPVVHFNTLMSAVCDWAGPRIAVLPSKPGMSSFVSIASSGSAIRQGCALCVRGAEEGQSQWFLYIVTSLPLDRDSVTCRECAMDSRALCPVRPLQLCLLLLCSHLRKTGSCAGEQSLCSQNRPKFCYCSHDKCSVNQP